jgi:predicted transport protein
MTTDEFFEGHPKSKALFEVVRDTIMQMGAAEIHVMKSQVEFRRKKNFAWVWVPGRYLRGKKIAPLVLTFSLHKEDPSPRWKQIVQTSARRYTHHLELFSPADIDEQVQSWLRNAWKAAK